MKNEANMIMKNKTGIDMKSKTYMNLTLISSIGLCLYSSYKIILLAISVFISVISISSKPGVSWLRLFASNSFWMTLTLGLCGLLFVYTEKNKAGEMGLLKHFEKIKQIVFSLFILFSTCMFFVVSYSIYSSINAYWIYYGNGGVLTEISLPILTTVITTVIGVTVIISMIMFGVYILTGKEKLRKILLPVYLFGFISTIIINTYTFINAVIINNRFFADSSNNVVYGVTNNNINIIITTYIGDILVMLAYLVIILYGINVYNRKIEMQQDQDLAPIPSTEI